MTDRQDHDTTADHLGPWPEATVTMFEDLGLAEDEIARHLQIDETTVRQLRERAIATDARPPWLNAPDLSDLPDLSGPPIPKAKACRWATGLWAIFDRLWRR
jgi:hypothetical protein